MDPPPPVATVAELPPTHGAVGHLGAALTGNSWLERRIQLTMLRHSIAPKNRFILLSSCFEFVLLAVVLNRAGLCP